MFFGEVVRFAAVVGEVVEFPDDGFAAVVVGYEFPLSLTDGRVGFVLPENGAIVHLFVRLLEVGKHADAFEGESGFAFVVSGIFGTGGFEEGRHDVDEVEVGFVGNFAFGAEAFGPVDDEWRGNAAFVGELFEFPER